MFLDVILPQFDFYVLLPQSGRSESCWATRAGQRANEPVGLKADQFACSHHGAELFLSDAA